MIPFPVVPRDSARMADFLLTDLPAGGGVHALEGVATPKLPSIRRQATLACTFDALVAKRGMPAPTLPKIEVAGAEAAVLRGAATRTLDERRGREMQGHRYEIYERGTQ